MIADALQQISIERLGRDLHHICRTPLPFRKVNYTRAGRSMSSLAETDAYLTGQLASAGAEVAVTTHPVQAFGCDASKPLHHWYCAPAEDDPWYDAQNLEARFAGSTHPEQIIQLISHKDSMSWIHSPGAHDNGAGTVANLELCRILAGLPLQRTVRVLFCNEEHTPWTSRAAADAAAERGDAILAVLNVDSIDGKSDEEMKAGRMTHVVTYSTDEGRPLAEHVVSCAPRHGIELETQVVFKEHVNDDDGMFIKAGFRRTVMNIGSFPYADSQYHLPGDTPDRVNLENLRRSTQLILAAVLELDAHGEAVL